MKLSKLEERLFKLVDGMEIIDCHEHLPPEKERVEKKVDIFTLFTHYTHYDLLRAGMAEEEYQNLYNQNMPIEGRWKIFAPYWERIRFTSYSRAVLLTVKKFYGYGDINERTYEGISDGIRKANKPGLYERVLRKSCKIRTSLTQCGRTDLGTPLLTPVMPLVYDLENQESLTHPPFDKSATVTSLDNYLDMVAKYVLRVKKEGAVGLKMRSNPYGEPNRKEAIAAFEKIKSGELMTDSGESVLFPVSNRLRDYVVDWAVKFAGEQGLVIAVHTGYWGDFRQLDPLHMIPILQRHEKVKFDIYHVGYPWVREALMLCKGFSNVWLNFCWTHIISQRFAVAALDEALDLVPTNKILAFGGDYCIPVEKVYGHLLMAKEDIVKVLCRRIEEEQMDEDEAGNLAHKWFWDNPKELYGLNL